MIGSPQLAKWVLGAFVLGTPLCPCASALAEFAQESGPAAPHHGGMHAGHGEPADVPETQPCHEVDTGADCGMADVSDGAGLVKLERGGDLHWAALPFAAARPLDRGGARTLARPPPDETRRATSTPITSGDRLLI